jgi:beta-barrel assembly-enhancing protease
MKTSLRNRKNKGLSALVAFALLAPLLVSPAMAKTSAPPPGATKEEIEMGRKGAESIEKNKNVKLLDEKDPKNKPLLDKLNAMVKMLGKASDRPKVEYSVKVIVEDDINAFTLPAGRIYITTGLIEAAGSDDEVAAVLSHEVAHTAHMHVLRAQNKLKPLQWVGLAAMIAALAGGENTANAARIAPYILTGVANRYSVELEEEADAAAIRQMKNTPWNPSAMVTFMQRLQDEERRRPEIELGIYQSHPVTADRVQSALNALKANGIAYTPRVVQGARRATVVLPKERPGVAQIQWGDSVLMELAAPAEIARTSGIVSTQSSPAVRPAAEKATDAKPDTKTEAKTEPALDAATQAAKARAEIVAARLNTLMNNNLRWHEISVREDGATVTLVARDTTIASVTGEDAQLQKTTPLQLARKWRENLGRLFWSEAVGGKM